MIRLLGAALLPKTMMQARLWGGLAGAPLDLLRSFVLSCSIRCAMAVNQRI